METMKKQEKDVLFIDTWLMSCRVLKRGMENFTLNTMVEKAKSLGYKRIIGEYIPTAKNKMVETHYQELGFKPIKGEGYFYELSVDEYEKRKCYINQK